MAEAMKGATKVMMRLNSQVNIPGLQKIMMEFEKQSEIMDMKVRARCRLRRVADRVCACVCEHRRRS